MKKFVSLVLALLMTFSVSVPAFASDANQSITDKNEIKKIAQEMGLDENPEDIEEIIISDCYVEENYPTPAADPIGPEEYIFDLTYHNPSKKGALIRSSDFSAPGGGNDGF